MSGAWRCPGCEFDGAELGVFTAAWYEAHEAAHLAAYPGLDWISRANLAEASERARRGGDVVTCDPVGAVEIATRCGVARRTVDAWRQRGLSFPEPRWSVGGRPAWDWPDIEAWARATGRLA